MKLSRYLILLLAVDTLFLLFCSMHSQYVNAAPEQPAEILFQQGNDFHGQGKYRQAIEMYKNIIEHYGISGPLLSNLANGYAHIGQNGRAILNYERALHLSPGDSEIKGNLDLLRKNQGIFQEDLPVAYRAVSFLNLDQWTILAGLLLVLLTLINMSGLSLPAGKQVRRWLSGLCVLCMVIAATGALYQYRQLHAAVVISTDAHLLISPFPSASSIGSIQEGRLVRPLKRHGNYSLIEEENGRTGWVETNTIEYVIEPAPLEQPR
jgi:tetratricopeptide (TPR) repeat protein